MSPRARAYWAEFCRASGVSPDAPVRAGMPGDARNADELLQLYLSGRKTAGSGLVRDYEVAGDPFPAIGEYWILLDRWGAPRCIVKTTRVELRPFAEVGAEVAAAESGRRN